MIRKIGNDIEGMNDNMDDGIQLCNDLISEFSGSKKAPRSRRLFGCLADHFFQMSLPNLQPYFTTTRMRSA